MLQNCSLRPELFLARIFHLSLTFGISTLGAGLHVPKTNTVAPTLQAQTAHLASVGWGHIGNDTTHNNVLDRLAVRTKHSRDLLTEQSPSLIHLGFIATSLATIFPFPGHAPNSLTY